MDNCKNQAGNAGEKAGADAGRHHSGRSLGLTAVLVAASMALLLAACGGTAAAPTPTGSPAMPTTGPTAPPTPTNTAVPADTSAPTSAPSPAAPTAMPTASAASAMTTVTIGDGSVARYLVREQLARLDFPNDAIGETADVKGAIAFDADGGVQPDASRIEVNLATLRSDSDRRDGYVRDRSLNTGAYPLAEFMVRETPGLPWPLPTEGEATFQMVGDMTLHSVTRPITWDVTAQFDAGTVSGQARTNFTFSEFDVDIPRVRVVLSVDDDIRLELDFQASVQP